MSQITDFLPQLQQLRAIYSDFIQLDQMDFEAYRKVVDFYYEHRDVGQFEKMMLDILFEKDKQTTAIVLSSIRGELGKILAIYNENDDTFTNAEPEAFSDNIDGIHYKEIEGLIERLNNSGAEFCEAVDMVGLFAERPEGVSENDAWDKYDTVLAQHQLLTEQLYAVYQKHKECNAIAKRYHFNPFASLCDLFETFQDIVGKYLPTEIKTVTPVVVPTTPSVGYFDMGLVSDIHKLCNGAQFEELSELEFYALLNNQPYSVPLKIKSGEKIRVCYLIHRLSERLKGASRADWRNEMLRKLDISEGYYASKYKEPESEIPSRKSEEFAEKVGIILKNIQP